MLTTPNPNMAYSLNNIIVQYNAIINAADIMVATEEFALGAPNAVRPLDIAFGYNPGNSQKSTNDFEISLGLVRLQYPNNNVLQVINNTTGQSNNSLLLSNIIVNDIYNSYNNNSININIQNMYCYGSVYISRISDGLGGYTVTTHITTAKNGDMDVSPNNLPMLLTKDYNINDMLNIVKNEEKLTGTYSTSWNNPIEIIRWVIDITQITNDINSPINNYKTYFIDMRKIRGWGGWAEENMAINLLSPIIYYNNGYSNNISIIQQSVQDLIANWISLNWMPDFVTYWNNIKLPYELSIYIKNNFGLDINHE